MYHFLYFWGVFLRKTDKNCVFVAHRNKIVYLRSVKIILPYFNVNFMKNHE